MGHSKSNETVLQVCSDVPVPHGNETSYYLQVPCSDHRYIAALVSFSLFIPVLRIKDKCEFATIGAESSDILPTSVDNEIPGRCS